MKTDILLSSTSYPIFLILLLGGVYFTIKLGFIQLRYPFLSLKILAGALDWRSSHGRITPGQAFFAGSLGSLIPGSFAATMLALIVTGPAIFPLLWLIHFFQASTEYVLSTSTHRSRQRNQKGLIESSPLLAATKLTRVRWAGLLYSVFFIFAALNAGSILNIFLLKPVTAPLKNIIPTPGALGLSVAFLFGVGLIVAGGIRRIGNFAKFTGYASIILVVAAIFSISLNPVVHTTQFLKAMVNDILLPYQRSQLPTTLLSVSVYFALAEYGSGRLSSIAGAVRTDHSAKQGLVAQLFPFLQIIFSFIVAVLLFGQLQVQDSMSKIDIEQTVTILSQVFSTISVIQTNEIVSPISYIFIFVLLLFLLLSTITWLYAGNMTFRHLTNNRIPNLFPVMAFIIALLTGYLSETKVITASTFLFSYIGFALFSSGFATLLAFLFIKHARQDLIRYHNSNQGKRDISRDLYLMLLTLLPANLISKFFGAIALTRFPRPLQNFALRWFAKAYNINLDEAEKPITEYPSLNSFFTRALKPGVRPIDKGKKTIVSPVDGKLSRMGVIQEGLLIQAKGIYYNLKDLLGNDTFANRFEDGHYCVIYLSPQDYHRMHTPFECEVLGFTYEPGRLFPVNQIAVEGLTGLFPKNERLMSLLRTKFGHIAMIKVGATNVGKIAVTYDSIRTNTWFRKRRAHLYENPPRLNRGDEIGRFEMGSTVILLFEPNTMEFAEGRFEGEKLKLGEPLGIFH